MTCLLTLSLLMQLSSLQLLAMTTVPGVALETESEDIENSGRDARNWDLEHSNFPPDLEVDGRSRKFPNVSIFKILRHGCFDHDVTRFCGNRMTRYSCLYWIDTHAGDKTNSFKGGAKVEANLKKLGLGAEFFENMDISDGFGSIDVQKGSSPLQKSSLFPSNETVNILKSVRPDLIPAHDADTESETHGSNDGRQLLPDCTVYRGRPDLPNTWRLVFVFTIPAFLLLGGLGNLLAGMTLAGMGRKILPLCYFSSAVASLDSVLILISAGDLWLRSVARVDANFMLLFACETCCQVYPMIYSLAAHMRQLCLLAIAIDTLMLYQRLDRFYPKYDRERVFNCFVLFCAILISLNCQFLWTFSLSRLDNPGETNRGYHCGFSDKWVEIRYKAVVWPLIDLMIGDLLPLAVSMLCCLRLLQLCQTGRCKWLKSESIARIVLVDTDAFVEIRRASLIAFALELPFSAPASVFSFAKFVSSASHMMQEHIFVPQSLRSMLGTQSHASFLDRKNRQDLFFTIDSVTQLLLFTWLSARPLIQFLCQATFRRQLTEILARLRRGIATNRLMKRRKLQAAGTRLSVVELSPATNRRCEPVTAATAREPFLMRRV